MSSNHLPCVSVGMAVYNCAATVDAAVRSIANQAFSDWELLLIDDGSMDGTADLARSHPDPRIRVFSDQLHQGQAARLNQAIEMARGKFFARMDGDDVSYPERLALQVEYLESHPEIDLLGGGLLVFGRDGHVLGTRESRVAHEQICRRPWAGFHLAHPTWLGRIGWFRKHLYRSEADPNQDQDMLLRSYENSRFAAIPEIVLGYREENLSLRKMLVGRRYFVRSAIREALHRRKYLMGVGTVVEHTLKGLIECLAMGTGLDYSVLRHRAAPADEVTVRRWKQVWEEVQAERRAYGAFSCAGSIAD